MNVSVESCLTFTIVFVAVVVGLTVGQDVHCSATSSKPHRRGLCGQRLVRAHTNLCFLLRTQFPELFMRKRSVDSSAFDIYSIPLATFADMDLSNVIPDRDFEKRGDNILSGTDALPGAMIETSNTKPAELSEIRTLRDLFQTLKYKFLNSRPKRQTNEVNILCECCFNECTVRQLATYC